MFLECCQNACSTHQEASRRLAGCIQNTNTYTPNTHINPEETLTQNTQNTHTNQGETLTKNNQENIQKM